MTQQAKSHTVKTFNKTLIIPLVLLILLCLLAYYPKHIDYSGTSSEANATISINGTLWNSLLLPDQFSGEIDYYIDGSLINIKKAAVLAHNKIQSNHVYSLGSSYYDSSVNQMTAYSIFIDEQSSVINFLSSDKETVILSMK